MTLPKDTALPFFSYGVFKPGELGFLRINEWVDESKTEEAVAEGYLFERNGAAMFAQSRSPSLVGGCLLRLDMPDKAYAEIDEVEPDFQYEWEGIDVETSNGMTSANILVPYVTEDRTHGHVGEITRLEHELHEHTTFDWKGEVMWWNGQKDVLFTEALDKIDRMIDSAPSTIEPDNPDRISGCAADHFFDIQMTYLLLWSVIERFLNIRYAACSDVTHEDRQEMATDNPFQYKFREVASNVQNRIPTLNLRTAKDVFEFDPDDAERSIGYYWRLRNNIAHRGKGAGTAEYDTLYHSCSELQQCFKHELKATFERSRKRRDNIFNSN